MHASKLTVLPLAMGAMLAACASSPGPDAAATKPGVVRVYRPEEFPDRDYEVLAELEESEPVGMRAPDPNPYRRNEAGAQNERLVQAAKDRVVARLRSQAAKLDADALVVVECGRLVDPSDPSTRYQETVRCRGFAVRFKVLGPDGQTH